MKKKIFGRVLGLSLALVMGCSTPISSLAQEDYGKSFPEDYVQSEEEFIFEEEKVTEYGEASETEESEIVIIEDDLNTEDYEVVVGEDESDDNEAVIADEDDDSTDESQVSFEETSKEVKNITSTHNVTVSQSANQNANTYKITYKLDGGKQYNAPSEFITGTDVKLTIPTKKGFIFDYWKIKVDGKALDEETLWTVYDVEENVLLGAKYTDVLNGNLELTAVYRDVEYIIVFCASEGVPFEIQPAGFGYGSPIRYSEAVDFCFAARELKQCSMPEMGEFDAITGFSQTPGGKADYVVGKEYSKLLDTEGVIWLYPIVTEKVCCINYDLDGGSLTKPICTFKAGKKTTLPKAKKPGYKFKGWLADGYEYDDENNPFKYKVVKTYDPYDEEYVYQYYVIGIKAGVTENVSVRASFDPVFYRIYLSPNASGGKRIVYDDEGDAHYKKVSGKKIVGFYTAGEECEELNYEWYRKGYNLIGLATSPKAKTEEDCICVDDYIQGRTGDITLYCVWSPVSYSVSFCSDAELVYSLNGKEGWGEIDISSKMPSEQMLYYGMTYTLPILKVPGCTFDRWLLYNIEADEPGISISKRNNKLYQIKADNTVDLCFIARFKDNCYTLKLDPNGGIYTKDGEQYKKAFNLAGQQVSPNLDDYYIESLINGIPESISRDGYVLRGIYLDKKGKKPLPSDYKLLAGKVGVKVTLYAVWDKE